MSRPIEPEGCLMVKSSLPWEFAVINDAIDGVARRRRLFGTAGDDWKQSAWLMLLQRANQLAIQFRGDCAPRTFLGTVLDRHCIDWLRRERRCLKITEALRSAVERDAERSTPPKSFDRLAEPEYCQISLPQITHFINRSVSVVAELQFDAEVVCFEGADDGLEVVL